MTAGIEIVSAHAGMIKRIAELEAEVFSDPRKESEFESALRDPLFILLAATDEAGEVCGYLFGSQIVPEAEIWKLAVPPDRRRQGIGRMLLTAFLQKCADLGCESFFLEVRESNFSARALYKSCGFAEYGRRKNYYRNPAEDAILMTLGKELS